VAKSNPKSRFDHGAMGCSDRPRVQEVRKKVQSLKNRSELIFDRQEPTKYAKYRLASPLSNGQNRIKFHPVVIPILAHKV